MMGSAKKMKMKEVWLVLQSKRRSTVRRVYTSVLRKASHYPTIIAAKFGSIPSMYVWLSYLSASMYPKYNKSLDMQRQ
jgi:hypothetical protein